MSGKYAYGITGEALDDLDMLENMAAFVADATSAIAESMDRGLVPNKKCWLGLYYLTAYIGDRIEFVHSQCGRNKPAA